MVYEWPPVIYTHRYNIFSIRGKPKTPTAAPDCDSFKEECKNSCLNKSVDIHVNECWGSPLYVDCKCSDGTKIKIPGFTCKSSECPVDDR